MKKFLDNDRNQGVCYIVMAAFFFAGMSFFVKKAGNLPVMEKCFFRNLVAMFVSWIMLLKSPEGVKIKKGCVPGLLMRSIFGTIGMIFNFYALSYMNISDANMLNKLAPFFSIIMSIFILKEMPGRIDILAVLLAFSGALLVMKPSFQMETVPALIAAAGGCSAGVAYTFVRKLGMQGERSPVIVMFFSTFSMLVTTPFVIFNYHPMELWQFVTLLCAGIAATGGQLCVTKAYTKAPAKDISVFDYSQVIFAAMLGMIFLGQMPDFLSVIGYVVIIGAAVMRWYLTRKAT